MCKVVATLLLVFALAAPAFADWSMPEFMISYWGGPGHTGQSGKACAQAGFNTVMCNVEALDECRKHGLKAVLFGGVEAAAKLRDDEAVWGYYLADEPNNDRIPDLVNAAAALRRADPTHPFYLNLGWPACPYAYVEKLQPQVLSYDQYWWWWKGGYFEMLEEYRSVALRAGIPLIVWVEGNASTEKEGSGYVYVPDNLQRLRLSVYTALAYGAKGIQWFASGHIFDGDQLTPSGKDVAVINAELTRLGPTLMTLDSVEVWHTPGPALSPDITIGKGEPVPTNTRAHTWRHWFHTVTPHVILGWLQDGEKNNFIMVVNRRVDKDQTVTLRFDQEAKSVNKVERFDKQTGKWMELTPLDAKKLDERPEWGGGDTATTGFFAEFRGRGRFAVEPTVGAGDGELLRLSVKHGD